MGESVLQLQDVEKELNHVGLRRRESFGLSFKFLVYFFPLLSFIALFLPSFLLILRGGVAKLNLHSSGYSLLMPLERLISQLIVIRSPTRPCTPLPTQKKGNAERTSLLFPFPYSLLLPCSPPLSFHSFPFLTPLLISLPLFPYCFPFPSSFLLFSTPFPSHSPLPSSFHSFSFPPPLFLLPYPPSLSSSFLTSYHVLHQQRTRLPQLKEAVAHAHKARRL